MFLHVLVTTYIMLISDMNFKGKLFILTHVNLEDQELMDNVETGSHAGFFAGHGRLGTRIMKISITSGVGRIWRQLDSLTRQTENVSFYLLVELFHDI